MQEDVQDDDRGVGRGRRARVRREQLGQRLQGLRRDDDLFKDAIFELVDIWYDQTLIRALHPSPSRPTCASLAALLSVSPSSTSGRMLTLEPAEYAGFLWKLLNRLARDRRFKDDSEIDASGWPQDGAGAEDWANAEVGPRWHSRGTAVPENGVELQHDKLAAAVRQGVRSNVCTEILG
eukprot:930683-Prymnesium_polylepis.1